ncbi:ABC transporter permease [Salinisphaera japonica]|uniref:Lipid kinase n=1 Tax=Salinisphaera japonica YTM-1 TaxID=1209778 RepID=A0A423PWS0_9GAMM|nr:ABC transporter permease subunit [Salinisphaera japonica]ROO30005.1 lipid kinase [Salinisphaera japonica YTM-1]
MKRLINLRGGRGLRIALALLPFIVLATAYIAIANQKTEFNPNQRLFPTAEQMSQTMTRMATQADMRSGEIALWADTRASLQRLGIGVAISATAALIFGLVSGGIPLFRAPFSPLITVVSLIPPMAILPILFIVFGTGEMAKIALIVIGITPFLIRDLQGEALRLPEEQRIKAQTLGANSWQVLIRVLLPQLTPRLISTTRLALGSAWLFLIAAEAIAAQSGLGYRIFLVRRYLSMDVILPYVAWITLLAFIIDRALYLISRKWFGWYHVDEQASA